MTKRDLLMLLVMALAAPIIMLLMIAVEKLGGSILTALLVGTTGLVVTYWLMNRINDVG